MKSGKRHMTDEIELPNQEKIRMHGEKETYKYHGILETDTIGDERKNLEKVSQENEWATRNQTISQEPYQRDKYLAVTHVRYPGPFLKWIREEFEQMNQGTRKLMTMYKTLHPRDDVEGQLCQEKKEENLPVLETVLTHRFNDSKTT